MGKSHTFVSDVKLGVVGSNEDIAKDPERTDLGGKVNAHETTHTKSLAILRHLQGTVYIMSACVCVLKALCH